MIIRLSNTTWTMYSKHVITLTNYSSPWPYALHAFFSLALIHSSLIHQRPQINTLRFLESPLTGESEPAFVGGLTNPFEKYAQVKLDHFQFGSG